METTTRELQLLVNNVCVEYTKAKFPGTMIDPHLLLRRVGEEYAELAEAMTLVAMETSDRVIEELVAPEIADMFNTLFMLASRLDLDVETIVRDKLEVLRDRTNQLRTTGSYK